MNNCYDTLYYELLNGNIRVNDDFRILQYECAIRSVAKDLNIVIAYNGKDTNIQQVKPSVDIVEKAGIPISEIDTNKSWQNEAVYFILLDDLYLDYPFLDLVKYVPNPNEIDCTLDEKTKIEYRELLFSKPSKLNEQSFKSKRVIIKPDKGMFGYIQSHTKDMKMFLSQFPDILQAKTKQIKENNTQKLVDMFYVYDQHTFFNKKIDEIIPLYNSNITNQAMKRWLDKITIAIHTYSDFSLK